MSEENEISLMPEERPIAQMRVIENTRNENERFLLQYYNTLSDEWIYCKRDNKECISFNSFYEAEKFAKINPVYSDTIITYLTGEKTELKDEEIKDYLVKTFPDTYKLLTPEQISPVIELLRHFYFFRK